MTKPDAITATLKEWRIFTNYAGKVHAEGEIYDDRKGRFDDGTWVITSEVVEFWQAIRATPNQKTGGVLHTKNSVYLLVGACNPTPGEFRRK